MGVIFVVMYLEKYSGGNAVYANRCVQSSHIRLIGLTKQEIDQLGYQIEGDPGIVTIPFKATDGNGLKFSLDEAKAQTLKILNKLVNILSYTIQGQSSVSFKKDNHDNVDCLDYNWTLKK